MSDARRTLSFADEAAIAQRYPVQFKADWPQRAKLIGGIVIAALTLAAVIMWMRSSRSGLQMRAMMMNPLGAAVVGVSVRTTGMRVLAISGALTGLSAVLLGQVFFVSPTSGVTPLTVGLIIALTPYLTAWGASALVVALLLLFAWLAVRGAGKRWASLRWAIDGGSERQP